MANPEHVALVRRGIQAVASFRRANPDTELDLSGAALNGVNLDGVDLSKANLRHANLSVASLHQAYLYAADLTDATLISTHLVEARLKCVDLGRANLRDACLHEANLDRTTLTQACLAGADLSATSICGGNLRDADLSQANLYGATLSDTGLVGTNLTEALIGRTHFSSCDLSQALALDTAMHAGPSDIGIDVLIKSGGKIPEVFLRGCGVPEEWITHIPAILGSMQPIQFYSCFISYSHADRSFAQRLYEALQARGIRCWLDEHQLLPGDDPHEQIDRGIRLWDKVLLCASKASLTSWWVDKEIAAAFKKEQQLMKERGKKVLALIPLDLDGFLFSDECQNPKAAEVRERIAAKFAGWDKDNALFEREFERLIKALQTNDTGREKPPMSNLQPPFS